MAPSAGHLHKLVVRNVKLIKAAWKASTHVVRAQLPSALPKSELRSIAVRATNNTNAHTAQNIIAYLKQSKRYISTRSAFARQYSTGTHTPRPLRYDRSSFPVSKTSNAVGKLTGRTPFASTLRPNLTGGALPRTVGGYSLGAGRAGGKRFFSHGPAAPAEVVQNVSQAVRAFWLGGNRAHFDGTDPVTGEKRYKTVSAKREAAVRKIASIPKQTPGSYVDFKINPTITSVVSLSGIVGYSPSKQVPAAHLNTEGLVEGLEVDFSRAIRDLTVILRDVKALCELGDLPISQPPGLLRVHFPGTDKEFVEKLLDELGVLRGVVHEDEDFADFVGSQIPEFNFPQPLTRSPSDLRVHEYTTRYFNNRQEREPIEWQDMLASPPQLHYDFDLYEDDYSTRSEFSVDEAPFEYIERSNNPWASQASRLSTPEGYESMSPTSSDYGSNSPRWDASSPLEYQDFEGIHRFMQMLDDARR